MDAEWSFLGFISNLAARIQNNGGLINVPLRYFRLVTSLISACQVGPPSNPTSSFGTLPFSCAIVFIVSGTPPLFCSSTAYFRLTAMTTPRRTGTRGRGRSRWLPFYNTLAPAFSARSRTGQAQARELRFGFTTLGSHPSIESG